MERANRTVIIILKKYVTTNNRNWDVKLPLVLMAIQETPHESTRWLHMTDLKTHLRAAFSVAQKHLDKSAEGPKAYYGQKTSHSEVQVWNYPTSRKNPYNHPKFSHKFLPRLSPVMYWLKISCSKEEPVCKRVHPNQIKSHSTPVEFVEDPQIQLGDHKVNL